MLLLTLRNYAGGQIERCTHQSRDEQSLLERILISMMLVGDIALSLRIFCRKRNSSFRRSEFISRARGRRFFGAYGRLATAPSFPTNRADITRPRRNTHNAKSSCWLTISSRAFRSEALKSFQFKTLGLLASIVSSYRRCQKSRHQLLRVHRPVASANDLFARSTVLSAISESPLDSLEKSGGYLTISYYL